MRPMSRRAGRGSVVGKLAHRIAAAALALVLFIPGSANVRFSDAAFAADVPAAGQTDDDEVIDTAQTPACPRPTRIEPTAWRLESDENVNAMRAATARTLSRVEAHVSGVSGDIHGFRAGQDYGLIYARDSATIAPAAQYLYDLKYLTSSVDEFLQLQYDGDTDDPEDALWRSPGKLGAISGTVGASEPHAAKMLVVSDEETSLITMAYVAYRAGAGPRWLQGAQGGRTRIERLNLAMDWLFKDRFDTGLGLIKRGHTTDWGDVEVGQGNTSGSFTRTPKDWTASIFDQAWAYKALVQLAEMNRAVDRPDLAEKQLGRARALRQATVERLWQPARGHFRTHIHVPAVRHDFDEDAIISVANALAVYSGITEPSERAPIFKALEQSRVAAKASKPGLTLYPTYPSGFFDYPQMQPGRYQNGAVWDWWGGMQISAQFSTGFSALAREHLGLVAADWARAGGEIYEWQEPASRKNGGSPAYAGAASTMTEAIVRGLYGVEVDPSGFSVAARLGDQSGGIHANHPPTGCWLDYWHTYAGDRIALEWDTNHTKAGRVKVLLPPSVKVTAALLDNRPVKLASETLGEDTYAVLDRPAPVGKHRLELRLTSTGAGE